MTSNVISAFADLNIPETINPGTHNTTSQADIAPPPAATNATGDEPPAAIPATEPTLFDHLVAQFGRPYIEQKNGSVRLKERFFAETLRLEKPVVFNRPEQSFFVYNPLTGAWDSSSDSTLNLAFLDKLKRVAVEVRSDGMHQAATVANAAKLTKMLKTLVASEDGGLQTDRPMIHVQNGVIAVEGDELHLFEHHPKWHSRYAIPFEYQPEAECPRFMKLLKEAIVPIESIALFQKWCGGVLLGTNPAQRFAVLIGKAASGKTTVFNIIEAILGQHRVAQLRTNHIRSSRFELAAYAGKSLLSARDVASDFLSADGASMVKALVGADTMEAERKGENERVAIKGTYNLAITCNAVPIVKLDGDYDAWRRRMLVMRFDRKNTGERTPNLDRILVAEEGPGILKWMVDGAIALLNDLADIGDFRLTGADEQAIEQVLEQSDSVKAFVRDGVRKAEGKLVTDKEMKHLGYEAFCLHRGWSLLPTKQVVKQLPEHMRLIHGVKLRNDLKIEGISGAQRGYKNVELIVQE